MKGIDTMKRVALVYDTFTELSKDESVQKDMFVNTLGKETIGDGYGSGYVISDEKSEKSVELENGLFANPYKLQGDLNLEIEKALRSDEDNALKDYFKNIIAELCDDIASEFVTKNHSEEENVNDRESNENV